MSLYKVRYCIRGAEDEEEWHIIHANSEKEARVEAGLNCPEYLKVEDVYPCDDTVDRGE